MPPRGAILAADALDSGSFQPETSAGFRKIKSARFRLMKPLRWNARAASQPFAKAQPRSGGRHFSCVPVVLGPQHLPQRFNFTGLAGDAGLKLLMFWVCHGLSAASVDAAAGLSRYAATLDGL